MRVLFLATVLPAERRGGGEIVGQSVIDALAAHGHDVRVVGYRRPGGAVRPGPGEVIAGIRPIETADAGRARTVAWMARALLGRAPYSSAKYESRAYVRAAAGELAAEPALVVADHAQVVFAVRALEPGAPLVFLAHNADGPMYAEAGSAAGSRLRRWANAREAKRVGEAERYLAERARQVWVLTEDDAGYFRRLGRDVDVRVLPVASSLEGVHEAPAPAYDVALLGTWNWAPNARGLEWFAAEVVPALPPGTRVAVGGVGAEWLAGRDPSVEVVGVVGDAGGFLSRARVIAVPSLAGGGIQIKTLDAIATGVPVVATPVAVRGLADLPSSVAVADGAQEFARSIARLAQVSERVTLRDEALAWSRSRRQQLAGAVAAFISELSATPAAP